MNVFVFSEGYRPFFDHFAGLLISAKKSKNVQFYFFINENKNEMSDLLFKKYKSCPNIKFCSNNSIYTIFKLISGKALIFGSPKNFLKYILLSIQIINRKVMRITLHPGNVLKASGIYKKRYRYLPTLIKFYLINLFFPFRILTATEDLKLYFSAAFAYPIRTLLVYPLPKHIYINTNLKSSKKKNIIYISPTHRWDNKKSPLEKLLEQKSFIKELKKLDFEIKYTLHPHSPNHTNSKISSFNGDWSTVAATVTDYSSIGYDYFFSGGKNLIYFIPDINEFESHEGYSPLFRMHAKNHYIASNLNYLYSYLRRIKELSIKESGTKSIKFKNNYFSDLYSEIYN